MCYKGNANEPVGQSNISTPPTPAMPGMSQHVGSLPKASSLPGKLDLLMLEKSSRKAPVPDTPPMKSAREVASTAAVPTTPACRTPEQGSGNNDLFDIDLGTPSQGPETPGAAHKRTNGSQGPMLAALGNMGARTLSDLDQYREIKAACGLSQVDQLLQLCCPTNDIELAVAEHLRHVRGQPRIMGMDTEDLAAQLLALGLLVQVRRGDGDSDAAGRNPRDCLRNLRHTFIVCTGYQRGTEPVLFKEPLILEPRFKEQFLIAHPTPAYEELLSMLPNSFVGTARRLEEAVKLLAEQLAVAFKAAGRSLPPWRSVDAMLSKWAPAQLAELGRLLRESAAAQQQQQQQQPLQQRPKKQESAFAAAAANLDGIGIDNTLQPSSPTQNLVPLNFTQPGIPNNHVNGQPQPAPSPALDMVRSMSRQLSSAGICAHSLPETENDRGRTDNLRRSLCGLQPQPNFPSPSQRTSSNGSASKEPRMPTPLQPAAKPARSKRSHNGACSPSPFMNAAVTSVPAANTDLNTNGPSTSNVSQQQQQQVQDVSISPADQVCVPCTLAPVNLLPPIGLAAKSTSRQPAGEDAAATSSSGQAAADANRNGETSRLQHSNGAAKLVPPVPAPTEGLVCKQLLYLQQQHKQAQAAAQPGNSNATMNLDIVRQSSTDLRLAVKKERSQKRSALAALLRGAPQPPQPTITTSPLPPSGITAAANAAQPALQAAYGVQGLAAPTVVLDPNYFAQHRQQHTQPQRPASSVRPLQEPAYPPRITTVKWGAAGAQ